MYSRVYLTGRLVIGDKQSILLLFVLVEGDHAE